MHFDIPHIHHAAIYARTDMQKLTREILRMEDRASALHDTGLLTQTQTQTQT